MSNVLAQPVLVLSRSWQPAGVVRVQKALVVLASGKAVVLDTRQGYTEVTWDDWFAMSPETGDMAIRSPSGQCRVPEIILLRAQLKWRENTVKFCRRSIYRRDNNTCMYCGRQPGSQHLNLDHVVPRSRGGTTTWENCVVSCVKCNTRKGSRTPDEAGMQLIRQPYKPKFRPLKTDRHLESWKPWLAGRE